MENFDKKKPGGVLQDSSPLPSLAHLDRPHGGSGDGGDSDHVHGRGSDRDHHRPLHSAQAPCFHSGTPHFLHSVNMSEDCSRVGWEGTRFARRPLGTVSISGFALAVV